MLKGKRTLVTGGAGFIGSHLIEKLLEQDNEVICFDDLSSGSIENVEIFANRPNYKFIQGDILNKELLNSVTRGIDYVFHYAAIVGVRRTLENPLLTLRVNIEGTRNILESSFKNNVLKVINASSSEVYGEPVEIPERENGHVNAKLPYAVSKLAAEKHCEAYYKAHGLKAVSLRFFNVYGPRQESTPYGFVVGIFIKQVLNKQSPTIFGDGTQTRDFVFVQDNVDATIIAAQKDEVDGKVLNIGTGKPTTIIDLAEEIIDIIGADRDVQPIFLPRREYDIAHRFPDTSLMLKLLGYRPRYGLREGLKRTIEWYKFRYNR